MKIRRFLTLGLMSTALLPCSFLPCSLVSARDSGAAAIPADTVAAVIGRLAPVAPDTALLRRGVTACANLWQTADGSPSEFAEFVSQNFQTTPEAKHTLFLHISDILESLDGTANDLVLRLQRPVAVAGADPLPVDYLISGYNAFSHLTEDLFANRLAFITMLNFPFYSLEEKNRLGADWDSTQWAYARLGDRFGERAPAPLRQAYSKVLADAENYIAGYNIRMDRLLTEKGERLFPEGMSLLSHWNLRDEIKANYADLPRALEKQEMIFKVMEHIVNQTIPACVINSGEYDWMPYSNRVMRDGKAVECAPEGSVRYQHILDAYHAQRAFDAYNPSMPSAVTRNFEGHMEVGADEVESLFVELLSSDEVRRVAALIEKRLGRKLRPFDIWYDGFKSRAALSEEELSAKTRERYPDAAAFHADMPRMLRQLGFAEADAEFIPTKIVVEPARGSGYAWPTASRWQPSVLRSRIGADGMDYKGYNIAVHEFGHNVEQTLDMYYVDHYLNSGIPNDALTEALAFVFQKRDLGLLGYPSVIDDNVTLDIFWGEYEVMGVALVDMYMWRWLYEHPEATAEELREAVTEIARQVWNKYYEPVLGERDCTLLAVYSHMVNAPMYLPNYPYGHLAEYQLEEYLGRFGAPADFAGEVKRIWSQGRLTPDVWMRRAVGAPVSAQPLLRATRAASAGG